MADLQGTSSASSTPHNFAGTFYGKAQVQGIDTAIMELKNNLKTKTVNDAASGSAPQVLPCHLQGIVLHPVDNLNVLQPSACMTRHHMLVSGCTNPILQTHSSLRFKWYHCACKSFSTDGQGDKEHCVFCAGRPRHLFSGGLHRIHGKLSCFFWRQRHACFAVNESRELMFLPWVLASKGHG